MFDRLKDPSMNPDDVSEFVHPEMPSASSERHTVKLGAAHPEGQGEGTVAVVA